ncbi:MAG: permease prefix domain 1-containing protein [Dehalococcoidia bacterium]
MDDPIERYLDDLFLALRDSPREARRLVRDAEDHLREQQDELVAKGMAREEAAGQAIARFGSVSQIVERANQEDPRRWLLSVAGGMFSGALWLVAIGFIAIGVSGVIALAMGSMLGHKFVAADPPGVTYTAERCADFERFVPDAPDCETAAIDHHYEETVGYRLSGGVLGLLLAGAAFAARPLARRGPDLRGLVAGAGFALFGAAATILMGIGAQSLIFNSGDGAGETLSAGPVALLVALGFGVLLLKWLREPRARILLG